MYMISQRSSTHIGMGVLPLKNLRLFAFYTDIIKVFQFLFTRNRKQSSKKKKKNKNKKNKCRNHFVSIFFYEDESSNSYYGSEKYGSIINL